MATVDTIGPCGDPAGRYGDDDQRGWGAMRLRVATLMVLLVVTACGQPASELSRPADSESETATADPTPTATESETEAAPADPTPTEPDETTPPTPPTPTKSPVVEDGWCSDEIVTYMGNNSTSIEFKKGFGRPGLLEGLDVGCTAIAREPSFAGYVDTFAFVRREKRIDDLLARRILDLGYTRDTLAPGVFLNAAGDPEGFIRILGEPGDPEHRKFADSKQWVVIQFYLPA